MASYVSVPRDLTKVKSKLAFNLTKRQIICFSVAALIGVPSFFLIKQIAPINTAVMCMMLIMMPMFFLALYEKNGEPLEVIIQHFIKAIIVRPKERPYKTDNYYAALERLAKTQKEIKKITEGGIAVDKSRKAVQKGKETVRHSGKSSKKR
ncbi:PrgI family protein [Butyrivibrio sp. VCB2006]|uniref:PrgI family protein n=1 Tax=Butyrivibrio sp. VCB2006 TaxID=1280679 RepID=UPI0004926F39|nr:PrgI family protein [Butyrivibrio sp. VCB2006]